ncbi:nuclear pore complex protein Nup214 [Elysia marginata]|uniref:Nuclear pore complex protein Nup214 n=1 Tax=Elysia marginata TaxID=1093978 RepID=A0AAV4H9D3_9GAST|nr:nuclear pore complex protein Nup214 [Elysia marginata]
MADSEALERDMKDFEFLQLCKFRVQPSSQELPVNRGNLLAASSKYGLLVYCTKEGFSAVKTSSLMKINEELGKERNKVVIEDIPVEKKVDLSAPVLCLSINFEGKYLAVATKEMGQLSVLFYDVNAFADKAAQALPFACARINATPQAVIQDLCWNPAVANMLAVCTSDGNVELVDVADNPKVIAALPAAVGATCFCWSPKGKQLLVGKKNGSASQYDHSLTEKKQWPCPNVLQGSQKVVDILWQSTYTFMAAYLPSEASNADQPKAVLVISNKENKTQYLEFDDIVFGSGEERKAQYFFHLLLQWEMILIASSNATEATVVGKNLDDKVSWEHWNLEDCSRAELPLTESQNDSFPVGMAVDYSPQAKIVINESVHYPACPVMYLLSTDGMLLGFHLSYRHKDAVPVTIPASVIEPNTARKGVVASSPVASQKPAMTSTPVAPRATSVAQTAPATAAATSTPSTMGLFGTLGQTTAVPPSFQFAVPGGTSSKPAPLFSTPPPTSSQPPNGLSAQKPPSSLATAAGQGFGAAPLFPAKSLGENAGTQGGGFTAVAGFGSAGPKFGGPASTPQTSAFVTPTTGQSQILGAALGNKQGGQAVPAFQGVTKSMPAQVGSTPAFGASPAAPPASAMFGTEKAKSPATPVSAFTLSKPSPQQTQQRPAAQVVSNVPVAPKQIPNTLKGPQGQAVESQKFINARLDSTFTQNIIEEIRDFEEELKQLRIRAQKGIKSVGSKEEKQQQARDTEEMINFAKEIKLVTKEHLREAQEQKNTSYNLFALAEECRVRHERDQDPHYHSLLQGRTLNPASAERLKRLQGMAQALEQSVVETDTVLNAQWDEYQAKRRKEQRMSTPTSDIIYKSIKNNHDLITHQRRTLEKVEEQLQNLKLYSRSDMRDLQALSMANGTGMSSLMENTKAEKTLQEAVVSGMTPDKVSRFKDMLSHRSVPVVKSSPIANLSMSRIVAHTPPSAGKSPSPSQGRYQQQQQQQNTPTGPPLSQVTVPVGKLSFVPG